MSIGPEPWLDRLEAALAAERQALLAHDVETLMQATADKLASLRAIEAQGLNAAMAAVLAPRLTALAESNQANGALLARRRREVNWALRHLGRSESDGAYDAQGRTGAVAATRALAVA